ncbi:unnamed protein product, partial [Ixodes persulcatus]
QAAARVKATRRHFLRLCSGGCHDADRRCRGGEPPALGEQGPGLRIPRTGDAQRRPLVQRRGEQSPRLPRACTSRERLPHSMHPRPRRGIQGSRGGGGGLEKHGPAQTFRQMQ